MSNLNNGGLTRVLNYIKTWVNGLLSGKSDTSHTHTKSQITDFPSIPSKTSQLTNDSGYLTSHQSLSNYVTLNSSQTITATKTISANLNFSTTYIRGTTPSSAVYKDPIDYKDSAGNRICLFESIVYTDKSSLNAIYAYNTSVASGSNIGYIGIGSKADGSVFTYAPTPSASDNSTQIATTAWVTSKGYITSSGSCNYATSATYNANGKELVNSIIKGLSVSGRTITYTKLDGSTGTITTQDTTYTIPTKTSQLTNDSGFWTGNGGTWNPNANISLPAAANNQEWSFDINRNGKTGCYWHVRDGSLGTLLKVNADDGAVSVPRNIFYLGSYKLYVG